MKYNNKSYIAKAEEKYPNKFDFSSTNYVDSYHKIEVICKEHNEKFIVSPISFVRESSKGFFCPKCKHNKKMTHDEFIDKIQKYKDMYDLSEVKFTTTRDFVKLGCKEHGVFHKEARFLSAKGVSVLCNRCIDSDDVHPQKIIQEAEDAVFYEILVTHKESKLQWIKIGITSKTTKERYSRYGKFTIDVLHEVFGTGAEVIELEREYKENNKANRFYLPRTIIFNGRSECYVMDNEYQLKASQVKLVRDGIIEKQGGICPLCKNELKMPTLDHYHSKKHNGSGLVRGVLCNTCNRFLGLVENSLTRNAIDFSDGPDMLRRLADFVEYSRYPLLHPTERDKEPKFMKSVYNKIVKQFKTVYPKKKVPEYPKSEKWTKKFLELSEEFDIS